MPKSGPIRNRKRTEIIIIDIIILLFLNNVWVWFLSAPFHLGRGRGFSLNGREYCADYKLIIVIVKNLFVCKNYDLPIHPYIFGSTSWNTMEYRMYRGCFNVVVYTSFRLICAIFSAKYWLTCCNSSCFLIVSIGETICFF